MIIDDIKNIKNYLGISRSLDMAINYLTTADFTQLNVGRYEISGTDVYVLIQEYDTKPFDQGKFEAHREYIDIQYVIYGEEYIGYAPLLDLQPVDEYDPEKDKMILKGDAEYHRIKSGMFGIYFPNDGHMPSVNKTATTVKKAVVKVKI